MQYRRYGKFLLKDYYGGWFGISIFLLIAFTSFKTGIPKYLVIWPIFLAVIMAWGIIEPNKECFSVSDNVIDIKKGRKHSQIILPQEITVIVSYADVCSALAKRVEIGNSNYMLKGRYAVSILGKIPTETVLEALHAKYVHRYTNCCVEELLKNNFIYSCVCDQELLEKILSGKRYTLILPETLVPKLNLTRLKGNIYIDKGF